MTDNFALFNEPRRPWLDPDALKAKFLSLSAEIHPDRLHNALEEEKNSATQRYAELNAAYNCLREPKERLLHLLELELGAKPGDVQKTPTDLNVLFFEVGQLGRDVDSFLAEKAADPSPLLKVQMFEQAMEWTDKLKTVQQKINAKRDGLARELQTMNAAWEAAPAWGTETRRDALPLERLERIYRHFSYLTRWTGQLQERVVQLSF